MPVFRNPPYEVSATFDALTEREYDWWTKQFRAPEAWKAGRGKGVIVAVLDTGCDLDHPDLQPQILKARDFTRSPYGPEDVNMHGSHCAGLVAAVENDKGVMGMAPDCKLLIGKVLGDDGSGGDRGIAAGIDWALKEGAHVISMSLGSQQPAPLIIQWVNRAIDAGVHVVMAAGNEGNQGVGYPAKGCPRGVRVAAVDKQGRAAKFSSRGPEVDIAAPGVEMLSCVPGGKWARMSGTSMATPVVAGVCALVLSSVTAKLTPDEVKERIIKSADDAGDVGHDNAFGWGLIRADKILAPSEGPDETDGLDLFGLAKVRLITHEGIEGLFLSFQ